MSEVSSSAGAAPTKKSGTFQSLAFGLVAVIVIMVGLAKTWQGVSAMFGWDGSAAMTKLIEESNAAYQEAFKPSGEADALFQSLQDSFNAQPLADARLEQSDNARETATLYREAAEQFTVARKKIDEALASGFSFSDDDKKSLTARSFACERMADVCQKAAVICEALVDESMTTSDALNAKLRELAAERDALLKEAEAALTESEKLHKQASSG